MGILRRTCATASRRGPRPKLLWANLLLCLDVFSGKTADSPMYSTDEWTREQIMCSGKQKHRAILIFCATKVFNCHYVVFVFRRCWPSGAIWQHEVVLRNCGTRSAICCLHHNCHRLQHTTEAIPTQWLV